MQMNRFFLFQYFNLGIIKIASHVSYLNAPMAIYEYLIYLQD